MKHVIILTDSHTHQGVELQRGAKLTLSDADAKFLVRARVARIVEEPKIVEITTKTGE